jgi:predicted glycoside hydrolase/deacetylase ChbG (UPF0249 family)
MGDVTVAERLGFGPDDRIVVVNADDLGACLAANVGVYEALASGGATSATLMAPCPWAPDAAARHGDEPIGVHLTLTAEHVRYRWSPLSCGATLRDPDGFLPRDPAEVWAKADVAEVRVELEAQIDWVRRHGIEPTHIDSHMAVLRMRRHLFDVYLDLAAAHGLPIRLSGRSTERYTGFPHVDLAADRGVLTTDHFVQIPAVGSRATIESLLGSLRPGITEVYLHPAVDGDELRSLAPDWRERVDDHAYLVARDGLATSLDHHGIGRMSFEPIRDLQRAEAREPRGAQFV